MAEILLLIDHERAMIERLERTLQTIGYSVSSATSGSEALARFADNGAELIIVQHRMGDTSSFDILRRVHDAGVHISIVSVAVDSDNVDAVATIRLGAGDVTRKLTYLNTVLRTVADELRPDDQRQDQDFSSSSLEHEAHGAARWARVVVRLLNAPRDPRTIAGWAETVFVSPGALRNWCYTAGIAPRRSLVFGRLLRAAHLFRQNGRRLENYLDVVDHRTLVGLLRTAGLSPTDFPMPLARFLERQTLVKDDDAIAQLWRAIEGVSPPSTR
jgi:ActR/RegA family two-component response regulator